jgi:hypothetical protein
MNNINEKLKNFKHLEEKKMTYTSHGWGALKLSCKMMITSVKLFVHAVYPDKFETAAIDFNNELTQTLNEMNKKDK